MNISSDLIEAKINSYATRCFLETADRDYIHARLAYRSALLPQFRWSALHALEKYGKCILLLNRINGHNIGHKVLKSIERVKLAGRFEIPLSDQTVEFIKRLESSAADRYLASSWYSLSGDLERLDRATVEIRRYCQIFDYEFESKSGERINLFQANLARVTQKEGQPLQNFPLFNGWLERIMSKQDHPAREGLLWNNTFFGSEQNEPYCEYSESQNSPFDLHPDVIEELDKWIYIPKERKRS